MPTISVAQTPPYPAYRSLESSNFLHRVFCSWTPDRPSTDAGLDPAIARALAESFASWTSCFLAAHSPTALTPLGIQVQTQLSSHARAAESRKFVSPVIPKPSPRSSINLASTGPNKPSSASSSRPISSHRKSIRISPPKPSPTKKSTQSPISSPTSAPATTAISPH